MPGERNIDLGQGSGPSEAPGGDRTQVGLSGPVPDVELPEGSSTAERAVAALNALNEIGAALREQGLTLEEMIERGRKIRGQLLEERYGIIDTSD